MNRGESGNLDLWAACFPSRNRYKERVMASWLRRQWDDIKGNVKYAIVLACGTAIVTSAVALTHGLQLWQQAALAACFLLLFGWAVIATVGAVSGANAQPHNPPGTDLGEQIRILKGQLVQAAVEINERDGIITELRAADAQLHAENLKLVDQGMGLQKKLAAVEGELIAFKTQQARDSDSKEQIRLLKEGAREIRRCWPDSDFSKRPCFRASWVPAATSTATHPWLDKAIEWHKSLYGFQPLAQQSERFLNSLDFDELMDLLDVTEGTLAGSPRRRKTPSIMRDPLIQVSRWGPSLPEKYDFGFFIHNHGEAASSISMCPISLGACTITTIPFRQVLLKDHGEVFLSATIRDRGGGNITGNNLAATLLELPTNSNGMRLAVPLRIVYQDRAGDWYVSRHEIEATDRNQAPTIQYINSEWLATLP
jgi:hypothetical protein